MCNQTIVQKCNQISGNQKLEKAKELIHEWEADIVGMVEHRQNLKHKRIMGGINFSGEERRMYFQW